jgi:hypothetical protein
MNANGCVLMDECDDTLSVDVNVDIGARWADLLATHHSSDLQVSMKAFLAADYDRIATGLYRHLCSDDVAMVDIVGTKQVAPANGVGMDYGFFTMVTNKLAAKDLINEDHCRFNYVVRGERAQLEDRWCVQASLPYCAAH